MSTAVSVPTEQIDARATVGRDLTTIAALFVGLSVIYWAGVFWLTGQAGFPLDDSYIHLQFARNLYEDGLMAFNRGIPSSGSTAPLYPVLLAGLYCITRDWFTASYVLGAVCSLGTAVAVYGILRSWTNRADVARWGGLLTVVAIPTVVQAYTGMESPVYSLCFLGGLWLYSRPRGRVPATLVFGVCLWLRPEFMLMLPIVAAERLIAVRRSGGRLLPAFLADFWPHAAAWAVMLAAYCGYHWLQDGSLVPNTFGAKAVAVSVARPAFLDGLPAALNRGNWRYILLAIFVWPTVVVFSAGVGLGVNCAPAAFGLREAILNAWREKSLAAAGWRLVMLTLIGYPWMRGFVDSGGFILFQFQRYYAHLTPLLIILVIGSWPETGAVVQRVFWRWRGVPQPVQQRRTLCWAAFSSLLMGALCVASVWNINSMQVPLGKWVRENTRPDQLVATNDIGAIAFLSERKILDTVGLVDPQLVSHFIAGGDLLSYLQLRDPEYVIIFPTWYPQLSARTDMLEPVKEIVLKCNVVCGSSRMVVYRPKWRDPPSPTTSARTPGGG